MTGAAVTGAAGTGAPVPGRTYEVRHRTEYTYEGDVTASYGWAHLTPQDVPGQTCRSHRIEFEPSSRASAASVDFFGNRATYFEVHEPHRRLAVTATSLVDVHRTVPDLAELDGWTCASAAQAVSASPSESVADYLMPSPRLPLAGATVGPVRDYGSALLAPDRPLGTALHDLVRSINRDFRFRAGATTVGSTLADLLERREGVCQDFAHLAVAVLRLAGLPARYVSGYLETRPPPGQPKRVGADASHAWVSVLVPRLGWVDLDPTNDKLVDDDYVTTAWGRDYSDVPPLKGVIFTESGGSRLKVAVDVIRR